MEDPYADIDTLDAPDPKRPNNRFVDGKGLGFVAAGPVALPTPFLWGPNAIDDALVGMVAEAVRATWWRRVLREPDDRMRVLAFRIPRRNVPFVVVHAIEFCDDEDQAKAIQRRMLEEWPRKDYAHARTIGRQRRRAIRLATLRGEPVPLE